MTENITSPKEVLFFLILTMFSIKIMSLIYPQSLTGLRPATFLWIDLIIVIILGIAGLVIYERLKFPHITKKIRSKKAILYSIILGLSFSLLLVIYDFFTRIGNLSVSFPMSVPFYIWDAISKEIIFRLFLISILTFIFGYLIFKKQDKTQIYYIIAIFLSILATIMIILSVSNKEVGLNIPNPLSLLTFGIIIFISEFAQFRLLKEYGFLSSLIYRLSFYFVWHIVWPVMIY